MPDISIVVEAEAYAVTVTGPETVLALAESQGMPGAPGGNVSYPFAFAPSLAWNIVHNLNRYPSVTILDTSGEVILASVVYVDSNVVLATFGNPTGGNAYLN